jgi:hypothetical protein
MKKNFNEQHPFFGQSGTSPTYERNLKTEDYMNPLVLGSPQDFLVKWKYDCQIEVLSDSRIKFENTVVDKMTLTNKFRNEYVSKINLYNSRAKGAKDKINIPPRDYIESALEEFFNTQKLDKVEELRNELSFDGSDLSELERLIKAITGNTSKLDIYCFAHFLWQIKRKIYEKEVKNHLMLVLEGAQGCGKSTVVDKIANVKGLENFVAKKTVLQLVDDRQWAVLKDFYLIILDEMQGCKKAAIDSLKSIITANEMSYRPMRTNSTCTIRQNCSFLGTTNNLIEELIIDSSGMRRFYAISCLDPIDWNAINTISFETIWKSINEDLIDGYSNHVSNDLKKFQDERRHRDSIEEFIINKNIKPASDIENEMHGIEIGRLFLHYKLFCHDWGFDPVDKSSFGKGMKKHKIESKRKTINKKKETIYLISSQAEFPEEREIFADLAVRNKK